MLKTSLTAAFVMLTLSACSSSASLVRKDTVGGQVHLQGAYMPAMSAARMLMIKHCGGRFEYLELGDQLEFHCKSHGGQRSESSTEVAMHDTSDMN